MKIRHHTINHPKQLWEPVFQAVFLFSMPCSVALPKSHPTHPTKQIFSFSVICDVHSCQWTITFPSHTCNLTALADISNTSCITLPTKWPDCAAESWVLSQTSRHIATPSAEWISCSSGDFLCSPVKKFIKVAIITITGSFSLWLWLNTFQIREFVL